MLAFTFEASLGENNKFEDFLTRVFKKKIKRAKKKEKLHTDGEFCLFVSLCVCAQVHGYFCLCRRTEEQEESDVESEELSDWDSDEDYEGSDEAAAYDLSVCPPSKLRKKKIELDFFVPPVDIFSCLCFFIRLRPGAFREHFALA